MQNTIIRNSHVILPNKSIFSVDYVTLEGDFEVFYRRRRRATSDDNYILYSVSHPTWMSTTLTMPARIYTDVVLETYWSCINVYKSKPHADRLLLVKREFDLLVVKLFSLDRMFNKTKLYIRVVAEIHKLYVNLPIINFLINRPRHYRAFNHW